MNKILYFTMLWFLLGLIPSVSTALHIYCLLEYETVKDIITWGRLIFFFLCLPSNLVVLLTILLLFLVQRIGRIVKDGESWFSQPIFK
jgi:hypothetical protein